MNWHDIATASVTLFFIMDPLGNVPVFNMMKLGARGARALERLMGMLLVILATRMLLNGVRDFVRSL